MVDNKHFRPSALTMNSPPQRFGIPRYVDHTTTEYSIGDGRVYIKHTSMV